MMWAESENVTELAAALGHWCKVEEFVWAVRLYVPPDGPETRTPIHRYRVTLGKERRELDHYDAAMAYLQALGVRDET